MGLLNCKRKTLKKGVDNSVDNDIYRWILETWGKGGCINSDNVIEKARRSALENHYSSVHFNRGWFQKLRHRFNLKYVTFHGEAASVPTEIVLEWKQKLVTILEKWSPEDIYNIDETGLFY